jgi:Kef-type K+ transport system membrane component KefB
MDPLLIITICLVVSLILAEVFSLLKSSAVIGLILAGIILNIPRIYSFVFSGGGIEYVQFLSNLGIIFLLFITGLEIDVDKLKQSRKEETLIAIFAALIPFALGFLITKTLGYGNLVAFTVGAALSITSEGTTIVVLMELKKLKTRIGTIILGAGIIDDVFEIIFLALVIIFAHEGTGVSLVVLPLYFIIFTGVAILVFRFVLPGMIRYALKKAVQIDSLGLIIIFGFLIASLSYYLGLGPIIGAFIAGILIQMSIKNKKLKESIIKQIKGFSFAVIIPFFFIAIGLNFNLQSIIQNPLLFVIILCIAILGKILGTLLTKPLLSLSWSQLKLIGWGMNSRGAVELVIAEIARRYFLIPIEIYTALVAMAIITTFIFPFVIRHYIKKCPRIME